MTTSDALTAISAAVAALTLLAGVAKFWGERNAERLLTWQRVVVHSIVESSMPTGLRLPDILSRYREEALTYTGFAVSKDTMSEPVLRHALLGLQAMNLLARSSDGRYVLTVAGPSMHDIMEENRHQKGIADAIMATVMTESGKYTKDELRVKLESATGASSVQFEGVLNALITQQQVVLLNGKLSRRL